METTKGLEDKIFNIVVKETKNVIDRIRSYLKNLENVQEKEVLEIEQKQDDFAYVVFLEKQAKQKH